MVSPLSSYRFPRRPALSQRLEERLEVPFAEALRAFALDDLEEQRRPISTGLVKIWSR
jgi:hypothetical protein